MPSLGIDYRQGSEVISIDRAASIVTLSNGSAIAYHRLMLATGARTRKLSIPIAEGANAATLRTSVVSCSRAAAADCHDSGIDTLGPQATLLQTDANGQIALINSRASEFIGCSSQLIHSDLLRADQVPSDESTAAEITQREVFDDVEGLASEAQLQDGRWLRVSRSPTQEGRVILVYSDITSLKHQKAELHATNLRLDAALTHMSQGLCLYDSGGGCEL